MSTMTPEMNGQAQPDASSPQPPPEFIIQAMSQEMGRLNDNRLWLMSTLAQRDSQLATAMAQISQLTSQLEASRTAKPAKE